MSAVDFRCEQCGKLLRVEAKPGTPVRCPHCNKKVAVPDALATLPRPQVPGKTQEGKARPPGSQPDSQAPPEEVEDEELVEHGALSATMARMMPWVLSLFLHVGVMLIMLFVGIIAGEQMDAEKPPQVFVNNPDATFTKNPGFETSKVQPDAESANPAESIREREGAVESDAAERSTVIATAGPSSISFASAAGGAEGAPRAGFMGTGNNAHHIVFVLDRSGSISAGGVWTHIKTELATSIGNLVHPQDFHVIFFVGGSFVEMPNRRLIPANSQSMMIAAKFIDNLEPAFGRGSNPGGALRQAFDVLGDANPKLPGRVIYMLTDGEFDDNQAVVDLVKELGKDSDVVINTFLYGENVKDAKDVLQTIAKVTGGEFRFIARE